ncbi:uncharacterized protein DS421_4g114600 [Arachis hypogaea]|nr:uncharacterized protein DS421_4g114600 [Arachis hypogaea]
MGPRNHPQRFLHFLYVAHVTRTRQSRGRVDGLFRESRGRVGHAHASLCKSSNHAYASVTRTHRHGKL